MKASFYDVKLKKTISAEVVDKQIFEGKNGAKRYALKGKTTDGRNLTKFCSAADYMSF